MPHFSGRALYLWPAKEMTLFDSGRIVSTLVEYATKFEEENNSSTLVEHI